MSNRTPILATINLHFKRSVLLKSGELFLDRTVTQRIDTCETGLHSAKCTRDFGGWGWDRLTVEIHEDAGVNQRAELYIHGR